MKAINGVCRRPELDLAFEFLTGHPPQLTKDCSFGSGAHVCQPPVVSFAPSPRHKHKLQSDGYSYAREFVILPSRSIPRWLLPLGDVAITVKGFDIYAPYTPFSRILKSIASGLLRSGLAGLQRNRVLVSSSGPLPLEELVHELTGESHPFFSLSLGAPSRFQKLTVQVLGREGVVLGYIKLPLTEPAKDRLRHEAAVLKRLEKSTLRPYVPRLLHAGPWGDGYIVFQSALEGAPGPTVLTSAHHKLLKTMREVHLVSKPGLAVVEHVGQRWLKVAPQLDRKWNEIGNKILRCCADILARASVPCGFMHGDFAPWNSKLKDGELSLFDWETAEEEAPLGWDLLHFQVQTGFHLGQQRPGPAQKYSLDACYSLYLLYSVANLAEAGPTTKCAIDYREKLAREQLERSSGGFAPASVA
jgi:phosphotransferase family enzyme